MRTVAVIGIKTNNVRLQGKNTRLLGGKPLFLHLWETIRKCKNIDRVLIDSSDYTILSEAQKFGFDYFERDPALNSPETSGHDLIRNLMPEIHEDLICQIFVTTPFLKVGSIDGAVAAFENQEDIDSIVPVYPVHDRFWYGEMPVSHDPSSLVGTQFMQPLYREGGFYMFKKSAFEKEGCRVTKRRGFFEVTAEECVDIDTELDFFMAEAMLKAGTVQR